MNRQTAPRHGTATEYENWGCRCQLCTRAMREKGAQKRARDNEASHALKEERRAAALARFGQKRGPIAAVATVGLIALSLVAGRPAVGGGTEATNGPARAVESSPLASAPLLPAVAQPHPSDSSSSPVAVDSATAEPTAAQTVTSAVTVAPAWTADPRVAAQRAPSTPADVYSAVVANFPAWAVSSAIAIASCESRLDNSRVGAAGERSVFQIHPIWFGKYDAGRLSTDVNYAARVAAEISNGGRNWSAWSCA